MKSVCKFRGPITPKLSKTRSEPFSNASSESTTAIETSIVGNHRWHPRANSPSPPALQCVAGRSASRSWVIEVIVEFHVRNHWKVAEAAAIKPR